MDGPSGREITYAQLLDQITKVGSALVKQGFKKGDVVTIFSPNCPEFATMYLAVVAIGGVVSAVNPLYTAGTYIVYIYCVHVLKENYKRKDYCNSGNNNIYYNM